MDLTLLRRRVMAQMSVRSESGGDSGGEGGGDSGGEGGGGNVEEEYWDGTVDGTVTSVKLTVEAVSFDDDGFTLVSPRVTVEYSSISGGGTVNVPPDFLGAEVCHPSNFYTVWAHDIYPPYTSSIRFDIPPKGIDPYGGSEVELRSYDGSYNGLLYWCVTVNGEEWWPAESEIGSFHYYGRSHTGELDI